MIRLRHIAAVVSLVLLAECRGDAPPIRRPHPSEPIVVAVDAEMPGCYVVGGRICGYQYELLEAYARYCGRELRLVRGLSAPAIRAGLADGTLDAAATLTATAGQWEGVLVVPLYETGYVMLSARRPAQSGRETSDGASGSPDAFGGALAGDGPPAGFAAWIGRPLPAAAAGPTGTRTGEEYGRFACGGLGPGVAAGGPDERREADTARIMVSAGFGRTRSYDRMLDSLPRARIFLTARSGVELAAELAEGRFDRLVCERSEAAAARALSRAVSELYAFPDRVGMCLAVSARAEALRDSFRQWLDRYRSDGGLATLQRLYLERGMASRLASLNKPSRVAGGISVWDGLLREVGQREGVDWRLLSAIAYNESRFLADVVSERGAQGLMQVMPVVAKQFGADEGRIISPQVNVWLAARLLHRIDGLLGLPDSVPARDRLAMVLAAYNSGLSRVDQARRAARDAGADGDRWDEVEPFVIPRRTVQYVADVLECYDAYCRAVER